MWTQPNEGGGIVDILGGEMVLGGGGGMVSPLGLFLGGGGYIHCGRGGDGFVFCRY
jgi:hypothetical protein